MKTYWIFVVAALWLNHTEATHQLFPQERSTYVLELSSKVSAETVLPAAVTSAWQLSAELRVSIIDDSRWRLTLAGLKTSLGNGYTNSQESRSVYSNIPVAALVLARPWEVHVSPTGSLAELKLTKDEPVWSANLKRAISVSLQMQVVDSNMPGSYTVLEPCLYGTCFAEYSSADGVLFRKSHAVPLDEVGLGRTYWASVMPDLCSKDAKKPFIGNAERWYRLDSKGLLRLDVIGDLQLHSHNHLLSVLTNMTLTRASIQPLEPLDTLELNKATSATYQVHSFKDPTNERHPINQEDLITDTINLLIKLADGIDDQRVGKDPRKVHDPSLLLVSTYMSQLTVESFQKLFEDIDLGTSYRQETMRNIFFEILPQVKSRASAVFAKNLIFQQKITDEAAVLQMIRKLPFNIADYSSGLLVELESFLKLGPDFSKDVRYSAVLSFATIVYNSYVNGGCSTDEFEEYIANYFSRYTDSPTYAERLVWLQGLHNLQLGSVSRYLSPILTGHKYSRHDRFLIAWAMWPGLLSNGAEINHVYWPILTNDAEHLEMKIIALTMLLHGSPTPERLLSLHWHVMASPDQQLRRFWYTTLKSLEKTTYNCYQHLSKMVSYIAKLVPPPSLRYWATGYYVVDVADVGRDAGAVLQVLTIGNTATGLPSVLSFSLLTQHQGRVTQRYEVYLKAQGVASNFINKLSRINAQSMKMEDLAALLKEIKVEPKIPEEVHIELVIKVQGKVVYATHIDGTTFDQWTNGDIMEAVNSILQSESHVNQQLVQYHMQLTKYLPTELGTPVTLETVVGSLSSLRGNLTHSMANEELARHNDVHVRLSTVASTSLSTYGPILDSVHTVDIQQAAAIHLPLKFHFAVVPTRKTLKLSWLNEDNTGGLAWHSQAVVTLTKGVEQPCSSCAATNIVHAGRRRVEHEDSEYFFDCESPISGTELLGQLVDSHKSNFGSFPSLRTVLATLHTSFLSGLPPAGPCGVLLSANSQLGIRASTLLRMELELVELEMVGLLSWKIRHLIVLEENKENGSILARHNGTSTGESTDYGLRLAFKSQFHDRNNPVDVKLCAKLETTHPDGPTQDLSSYPGPFQGEFTLAMGPGPSVCPGGPIPTRLKMRYKGAVLVDEGVARRVYDVHFYGVNLPEVIPKLAQSIRPILQHLPQTRNLVALQHLAGKLAETPQNISASIQIENGQTTIDVTGTGNNSRLRLDGEQLAWMFDYWNRQQLMRELGLLRECKLQPSSIKNVFGEEQSLVRGKCGETLAAADCSDSPRFALFHEALDSSHGVTLYTGGHYAQVRPGAGGKAEVTVNGRRVEYFPTPYQFPEFENFYDFKISGDATSVRLFARVSGITLAWTSEEAVLLLPTTYMQTACGACIRKDRLIERCPGHR